MAPRSPIKLNGVVLPPHMIAAEAQHHPAKSPAAAFEAAARAIIIRTLLLEEANRRAIAAEPQLAAPGKRELDDEAKIRALIEAAIPVAEPGEDACRAFYEANGPRFRSPDLFEASHILFAAHPHDTAAYDGAVARASEAIAELLAEPGRFEAIARERSECDSRANGGRLGQITHGQTVPEFESVLYVLNEGDIAAEPVKSRFGAHVLRLDARAFGDTLPFEYVRDRIAAFLAEQTWRRDVARFVESLVSCAEIEGVEMAPARDKEAA
ncbi:MAG: peptidyl-prolyl cis-trans isomerase [Proteobacteria bacterium]|nr:peptidyl-prolyl cis-trans isomerase [Pseudomonadota bacterium]